MPQRRAGVTRHFVPLRGDLRRSYLSRGRPTGGAGRPRGQPVPADLPGTRGAGRQWAPQRDADHRRASVTSWPAPTAGQEGRSHETPPHHRHRGGRRRRRPRRRPPCSRAPRSDRPQPLPALTARALAARYAADSRLIARAAERGQPGRRRRPGPLAGRHARPALHRLQPRAGRAWRSRSSATWPGPGGWPSWCPAPTPPWPRSTPGARPRPRAAPAPWRRRPAAWTPATTWRSSPGSATPRRARSARP